MRRPDLDHLKFVKSWLSTEELEGQRYAPLLLDLPTAEWRSAMRRHPDLRRYGTLQRVLSTIHEDIYDFPIQARERAAVVVKFAEVVDTPEPQFRAAIAGLAWKEYANALRYNGKLRAAYKAARTAQEWYEPFGTLTCESAKARLAEALIQRELTKDLDGILRTARECATIFRDYGEAAAFVNARMTEALALSDAQRHKEAMAIFTETAEQAEVTGDRHTLAICLHNAADCARALGDIVNARKLDARASAYFEELGSVERPRIRWTEALALAAEGRVSTAILELRTARAELLKLGMNTDAALYGLEVVALRHERGEDVTADLAELVETFTKAGMIQSSLEAIAYLRQQSAGGRISPRQIHHVKKFIRQTAHGPSRLFVPPQATTDDGGEA